MLTDVRPPGAELHRDDYTAGATGPWSAARVRLTMLVVSLIQICLVGFAVQSSGFLQDDYLYFDLGRKSGLTLHGLTSNVFGSLVPGFSFVNTLFSFEHPISRLQLVLLVLVLYAAIILIFYRLLELLFGARPAIVAFTAIATSSGLLGVSLDWWTPAINSLPAIAADLLALDGLARHATTGKRRYLVVSIVSFAIGTTFYDPSITVAVTLVLFTALYLADRRDFRSVWRALLSRGWVWVGYALPIVANLGWRHLHPTEYVLPPVAGITKIIRFMGTGWAQGFAPSSIGVNYLTLGAGAWKWEVVALGQVLLIGVVVVSISRRSMAWRAWLLFGASFLVADLVAAIGRAWYPTFYALNSLYWDFYGFLFWICVGLAFLPSKLPSAQLVRRDVGRSRIRHSRRSNTSAIYQLGAVLGTLLLCGLGLRYIWAVPDRSMAVANTSYIDNVQRGWEDVSSHQSSAFVWNTDVPVFVLNTNFAPYNRMASTIGLVVGGMRFDLTNGQGYEALPTGQLVPAIGRVISQVGSSTPTAEDGNQSVCIRQSNSATSQSLPLTVPVLRGDHFVRIHYNGSSGFDLNDDGQSIHLKKGDGTVLAPISFASTTTDFDVDTPREASACMTIDVETPVPTGPAAG